MPKTRKRKSYSKRRTASLQLDIETSTDKKEVTSDISNTEPNGCTSTNEPNCVGILDDNDMSRARVLVNELKSLCTNTLSSGDAKVFKANADWMKKYMRNQFEFYGFKSPLLRNLQTQWLKQYGEEFKQQNILRATLQLLWEEPKREMQTVGCDLAYEYRDVLLGDRETDFKTGVLSIQSMITTKSWWDTVDRLSYPVIGYFVQQRPQWGDPLMEEWIKHENMWLRRVAILHQLFYKDKTNQERLFQFCISCASEEEFFIRKAIGWALRQYGRTNPKDVKNFVEKNKESLSNLSIREALKHIR